MAESVNFEVIQGDTFTLNVTYRNKDGSVVDLTGYNISFSVRDSLGGKVLCATCSIGDGIEFVDALTGKFRLEVSPEKTRKFVVPRSVYQLQLISPSGIKTTVASGTFAVEKGNLV